MCEPATIMMATMATVQAVGSIQQGQAADRAAQTNAAQMEYQALVERDNAQATAQMIRRDGERSRGSTVAAVAMSGAKIGEWSAGDVERQVLQDTETDALTAILNGERQARSLNDSASSTRAAGRDARRAGYFNAATSLLSAGAQGMKASGWRANGPGFSGTQAPAPVETRTIPRG
ncbi:hypothetical protein [Roseateles sp. PN1]|uniref:hypothetical protein n=1 Tax=Roseateles sp. PN1 TaxID=3137372 RepID=UPI003139FC5D